jgi:hypothetical protein
MSFVLLLLMPCADVVTYARNDGTVLWIPLGGGDRGVLFIRLCVAHAALHQWSNLLALTAAVTYWAATAAAREWLGSEDVLMLACSCCSTVRIGHGITCALQHSRQQRSVQVILQMSCCSVQGIRHDCASCLQSLCVLWSRSFAGFLQPWYYSCVRFVA